MTREEAPIDEWTVHCPKCGHLVTVRNGDEAVACTHCHAAFAPEDVRTAAWRRASTSRAPKDPHDELVGRTLGDWQLLRLIGRGGMGRVYEAKGRKKHQRVAIKVLSEDLAADPSFVKRFRREARVLASLSHPHVVEILDRGETGGRVFFAMEYIRGENLRRRLEQGPLPPEDAIQIAREVTSALAYAHEQGVVHRDLKPENVLLDEEGHVHLVDFGLSRLAGDGGAGATTMLTRTDVILGTYEYMAPEQRRGDKTVDGRADLFALGVILYEMLTGQLPLGRFAPPSRSRSEVPTSLDVVINKALATERGTRYASAGAMNDALAEAWAQRGRRAPKAPPQPPQPPQQGVRAPDRAFLEEADLASLRGVLRHVDVLAALDRVLGVLLIFGAMGAVSLTTFLNVDWFPVGGVILFILGVVFLQFGGKLSRMRPGSRDRQITASVFLLIFPPFLTLMGMYGLLVLTGAKARRAFAVGRKALEGPPPVIVRRPVEVPRPLRKRMPRLLIRVLFLGAVLWTLYAIFVAIETGHGLPDDTLLNVLDTMSAQRLLALKISAAGAVLSLALVGIAFVERRTRRGFGLAIVTFALFAADATVLSKAHRVDALASITPHHEALWVPPPSSQPRLEI